MADVPKLPTKVQIKVQAVYGLMVEPTTAQELSLEATEVKNLTPWMQCQIDAGKLKLQA